MLRLNTPDYPQCEEFLQACVQEYFAVDRRKRDEGLHHTALERYLLDKEKQAMKAAKKVLAGKYFVSIKT